MKGASYIKNTRVGVLLLVIFSHLACNAAQFIDVTFKIEVDDWDYRFLSEGRTMGSSASRSESIFTPPATMHCLFSTNTWMMEGDFYRNAKAIRWFDGSNILEYGVITQSPAEAEMKRISQISRLIMLSPSKGSFLKRVHETTDGNPGRPIRVSDLMELRGRICWLAFCSGSVLKQEGRRLYPPSDLWKELFNAPNGFTDKTAAFDDSLGLPRRVELFTPKNQLAFKYQVHQTTNMMGWNIPTEFFGVQYRPARTNSWEVQLTFKGKVTAINPGDEATIQKLTEKFKEN